MLTLQHSIRLFSLYCMELKTITIGTGTGLEMVLEPFTAHGYTVPAGFIFDGASTPWMFWPIIPPYKNTKKAACIHDYICQTAKTFEERRKGDKIFYKMLREAGFGHLRALLGYAGVTIFSLGSVIFKRKG